MSAPAIDLLNEDGSFSSEKAAKVFEESKSWPPEMKQAALVYMQSAAKRETIKKRYKNAAEIAAYVDPEFVITPAISTISAAIETVLAAPRRNLIVTMPPQEGKSTLCCVYTPIRAWQLNPNLRIIIATYGDDLALQHSTACRSVIEAHGSGVEDKMTGAKIEDRIGLKLSSKSRRMDSWRIEGAKGGLVAAGLGSAITGRPADLFIIDDPYKNMQEADSETHREKVDTWMRTVARTRLSPQASMILIQTRWHQDDLAGKVLQAELELEPEHRTWRHINIPAISQEGIKDSLNRTEMGEAMESARGRTKHEFEQTRRSVGERYFLAMYQGSPTNPEGGLFARKWFDPPLLDEPKYPVAAVVAIDPADSGEGDETGLIGGVLAQNNDIVLTQDWSDLLTSSEWSRRAVEMAATIGARDIVMEGYSTFQTYKAVIASAWRDMHREVTEKLAANEPLEPWEIKLLSPNMPFLISKYTESGDAEGRASLMQRDFERHRAKVMKVRLAMFETQACDWQSGQHCPDRVSAAVILHWHLNKLGAGRMQVSNPLTQRGMGPVNPRLTRRISDGAGQRPFGEGGKFQRY